MTGRLWRGATAGAATAIVSERPFAPGPLGSHKTTSRLAYHLAREEARAARADEALLADAEGALLEGAVTSVFAVVQGTLRTAPLQAQVLPGITRAFVIETAAARGTPVVERAITHAERPQMSELFVTNAIQGVVPIATLNGRPLPERTVGEGMRQAWLAAVREEVSLTAERTRKQ